MGNELSSLDARSALDESVKPRTLPKRTASAVADHILGGHVKKVVFMVRLTASILFIPLKLSLIRFVRGYFKAHEVLPMHIGHI